MHGGGGGCLTWHRIMSSKDKGGAVINEEMKSEKPSLPPSPSSVSIGIKRRMLTKGKKARPVLLAISMKCPPATSKGDKEEGT